MAQYGGVWAWNMHKSPLLAIYNLHPTPKNPLIFYDIGYMMIIGRGGCIYSQKLQFKNVTGYWPGSAYFCRIYHWRPHWGTLTLQKKKVLVELKRKRIELQSQVFLDLYLLIGIRDLSRIIWEFLDFSFTSIL